MKTLALAHTHTQVTYVVLVVSCVLFAGLEHTNMLIVALYALKSFRVP